MVRQLRPRLLEVCLRMEVWFLDLGRLCLCLWVVTVIIMRMVRGVVVGGLDLVRCPCINLSRVRRRMLTRILSSSNNNNNNMGGWRITGR